MERPNCPSCTEKLYPYKGYFICTKCGFTIPKHAELSRYWNEACFNQLDSVIRDACESIPLRDRRRYHVELSPVDYCIFYKYAHHVTEDEYCFSWSAFVSGMDIQINRDLDVGKFRIVRDYEVNYGN